MAILGLVLAVRLIGHLLRKSIWRLRNRLIVTYVFIGVVPIVLILNLAVLGTLIVVGQVAAYLVSSELERRAASLADPVRILSQAKPADRPAILPQMGSFLGTRLPGLQMLVDGDQELRYPKGGTSPSPAEDWKITPAISCETVSIIPPPWREVAAQP